MGSGEERGRRKLEGMVLVLAQRRSISLLGQIQSTTKGWLKTKFILSLSGG
jgi:hypothetical protein